MVFSAVAKPTTSFAAVAESNELFLLKEDGDFLLKEDGGKIIIGFGSKFAGSAKPTTSFTAVAKP